VSTQPDDGIFVFKSPPSGVSLVSLGDFNQHMDVCQGRVAPTLQEIGLLRAREAGGTEMVPTAAQASQPKRLAGSSHL